MLKVGDFAMYDEKKLEAEDFYGCKSLIDDWGLMVITEIEERGNTRTKRAYGMSVKIYSFKLNKYGCEYVNVLTNINNK